MNQKQFIVQSACSNAITEDDLLTSIVIQEEQPYKSSDFQNLKITLQDLSWIVKHLPYCISIAKSNSLVVGSTLVIPCSATIMNDFLLGNIPEQKLLYLAQTEPIQYDCLYLASASFLSEASDSQLISQCFLQSIQTIQSEFPSLHSLFYWSKSQMTKAITDDLAQRLAGDNLNLFKK